METLDILKFILVFIRSILYPLAAFMLLVMAYSANNRKSAKLFRVHILTAVIFLILGLMAAVRLVYNSTEIINNIGNFVLTPLLVIMCVSLGTISLGEEKRFIHDSIQRKEEKQNGYS